MGAVEAKYGMTALRPNGSRGLPYATERPGAAFTLGEHLNVFMKNFVPVMGKGTASLLLATGAGLLIHAGIPEASIGGLWALLRR
jgi:hypothetical protein